MGRKADIREVDQVALLVDVDRHELREFIHELKRSGERGSRPNGDFTFDELRTWAECLRRERSDDGE